MNAMSSNGRGLRSLMLLLLAVVGFTSATAEAQTVTYGTGTLSAASMNPVYRSTGTSAFHHSAAMMLYSPTELVGLPAGSVISSVKFFKTNTGGSTPTAANNVLKVWLRNTTATSYTTNETGATWTNGATLVVDKTDFFMPTTIDWIDFGPFNTANSFIFTGGGLEILVHWDCSGGTTPWATAGFNWRYDTYTGTATDSKCRNYNSNIALGPTSTLGTTTVSSNLRLPHVQVSYLAPTTPLITTLPTLPAAFEGTPYSASLSAIGGASGPYTWAVTAGTLPTGLTLGAATGVISGTPAAATSSATPYSFTISATDTSGNGTKVFSLLVTPLSFTTPAGALLDAAAGFNYNQSVVAAGGTGNITYSITAGALPPGMTLAAATGAITGIPPTSAISTTPFDFTVQASDTVTTVTRAFSIRVTAPSFEVLTSATESSTLSSGYPFNTGWHDQRLESIYLASELTAAGMYAGAPISGIQLKVAGHGTWTPGVENFRIRVQHTSANVHPAAYHTTGWTLVHGPITYPWTSIPVNSWVSFQFTQPFTWNGTDNLLFDFTTDGTDYAGGGGPFTRATPVIRSYYGYNDSASNWPFDTGMNGPYTASNVPSLKVEFPPPQAADLDVFAVSFGAANNAGPTVGSNTINATVQWMGLTAYTGNFTLQYSTDGGSNWVTQGPITASTLTGTGTFQTVTFTTPWSIAALANSSLKVRINPQVSGDPDPNFDEVTFNYTIDADLEAVSVPGPFVGNNAVTVMVKNSGTFSLNGVQIPLQFSTDGQIWTTVENFIPTQLGGANTTQSYTFTAPWVLPAVANVTLQARINPQLTGDPDTSDVVSRQYDQAGGVFEIGTNYPEVASPGGNASGYPFNTWYHDSRMESIYLSSELTAAGLYPSAQISAIHLKVSQLPDPMSTSTTLTEISDFRIRLKHTTDSVHSLAFATSGYTLCYGPSPIVFAAVPPVLVVGGWAVFQFSTPFTWNGTDNLMVDVSHDNAGYTNNGGCFLRTTPGISPRHYRGWTDSVFAYPFDTMSLYGNGASVPSIRMSFPPPSNPGLTVSRAASTIVDAGSDALGIAATATIPTTINWSLLNYGASQNLSITAVNITSMVNCVVSVAASPIGTPITPLASGTLGLSITAGAGAYSFNVELVNNSESVALQSYTFSVSGTGFINTAPTVTPVPGSGRSILITEVASDPIGGNGNEFIELTNVSTDPVNIAGWQITIYDSDQTGGVHAPAAGYPKTIQGTTLLPGQTWVLSDLQGTAPANENLGVNIYWNAGNSGGVMIRDAQLDVVDVMLFGTAVTPSLITAPVAVTPYWTGLPIPFIAVLGSSYRRTGSSDSDSAADWIHNATTSVGVANTEMTLPFGGHGMQVSGTHPNYLIETVVGSDLSITVRAQDPDSHQSLTLSLDSATGGSLTPTAAGFSTTTFPITATPGGPPRAVKLLGTALASGTVNFTATAADNGAIPGNDTINFTVKIGARLDVDSIDSSSLFVRVSGQKDFYRGQTGQPIDIRVSNNNPFAITLNSLDISVQPAAGGNPLTGFTFNTPALPMSIPANTTNMLIAATMDIAANASGGNDLACELTVNTGLAVDPAAPTTNPIIVIVEATADEFQLFDGPVPTPMSITLTNLLPAVETVAYLQELTVAGGLGTYTWSITSGTLPTGLTLNASGSTILNASISGTPALATAGPYPLTLQVSDGAYLATIPLTLNVSALVPLAFPPVTLATATEFVPYTMTAPLAATGGSLIYTYGIDTFLGDDLPSGLTLNTQTGVITGTPAFLEAGTYTIFFTVDDGITLLTQPQGTALVVDAHPLQWNTTVLPTANETVNYSFTLDTVGGTAPRIYSITTTGTFGVLPNGLTMNNQSGEISGVPAVGTTGTYTIGFRVASGPTATEDRTLTLNVVLPPPLTITTAALSYAEIGQSFNITIAATGGSQNYTFSTGGGVLSIPNSVALSANGELSGTPEFGQDGRFPLTVVVNDGYGTASKTFDLTVLAPEQARVKITEVDLGTGYIELSNTSQQMPVDMSGWRLVAWIDGNAPASLTFDTIPGASLAMPGEVATVTIGGTAGGFWPTFATGSTWAATSTSNMAVALYDVHGNLNDFVVIGTVNVAALQGAAANPANIHPDFAAKTPLLNGAANHSLGASNTFTASAAGSPGAYNTGLPVQALDVQNTSLSVAQEGAAYWHVVFGTGGAKPYVYSIAAPGAAWLSINATTGVLTGTAPASSAGTVVIDVTITDANLAAVTETVNLTIVGAAATPGATFTVGLGEGQSFEGTIISVPVTMSLATGVNSIDGFSFVIDIPAATSAELAIWRVLPGGATLGAGRGVVARDIGNDQIFVGDIDLGSSSAIQAGVVAIVQFIVPSDDNIEAPEDTYLVGISNVSVAGTTPITASGVGGSMELSNYAPADVNRDNIIDVVDVQLTVNIILSLFTPTYTGQGDANLDTLVDVVDVQTVVNCILFGGCN